MDITFSDDNNFKIKSKSAITSTSPFSINDKTIYGAGEYEVAGVSVLGFRTKDKFNIYVIEADKLNVVFLGNLNGKIDDDLIDELGDVDVVLTTTPMGISEALRLEPYFVISTSEESFKESGMTVEQSPKFSIKKEDILEEQNTKAIVLTKK